MPDTLAGRFRAARRDPQLVVLEGFHALKHALRFGADVLGVAVVDASALAALAAEFAPDLLPTLPLNATQVTAEQLAELCPRPPRTGVIALARRPSVNIAALLADPRDAPVVLLEDPRTMGNLGACIRVAAAAAAAGVLTTGAADPWNPDAVRGAAGLQFALPVARLDALPLSLVGENPHTARPLIAVDPDGDLLAADTLDPRAILAFGTERDGLSDALLAGAQQRVRLPMRAGVSSLNLATAVAAVLYGGYFRNPMSS